MRPLGTRTAALLTMTALALGGCGIDDGSGEPGDKTLTIALPADVRSLWANSTTVQREINITEQISEKLVEFSPDAMGYEPRLATSWKQTDPLTWRFTLRTGVKFTNGEPFDARSAKISFDAFKDAPMYKRFTGVLDKAVVVDNHTLDVKSTVSTERTLMLMAMGSFQYPAKYYQQVGKDGFVTKPIGTGPFVVKQWRKGDRIEMTANKNYWRGAPKVDRLVYRTIPDKASAIAALKTGEIDLVTDVPVGSLASVKGSDQLKIQTITSNRVYQLVLSEVRDTPLRKPEVRRALQYAIDVDGLIKNNLAGQGKSLNGGLLIPAHFGYEPGPGRVPYDPAKAKKLLADAGYPNGFSVTFNYTSGGFQQDKELGQAMAGMLEKAGLKVEQRVLEPGTFATQLDSPRRLHDMWFSGSLTPPDAHMMYEQYISDFPYSYYDNPRYDALFKREAAATDDKKRNVIVKEMTALLREDPPAVPLFQMNDLYGLNRDVKGFVPRASQFIDVYPMSAG